VTAIEWITIGKIINAHGCQGWVRILPLTDYPQRFLDMRKVTVVRDQHYDEYGIDAVKRHKQMILLKLSKIDDMNAALSLKGALLQVRRTQLVKLPADTYYIFDLLGLEVYTVEQEYLGIVKDVLQTGANDVYVVANEQGDTVLIPALKAVVQEINFETRQIRVDLPEGLR